MFQLELHVVSSPVKLSFRKPNPFALNPSTRPHIADVDFYSNPTPTRLKLPSCPHRLQHRKNHGVLFSATPPLPSTDFSFSSPEEKQQQATPPAAAVDDAGEKSTTRAVGAKRKKAGGKGGGPVGRAVRRVLSFMTILTTTYLFRFLLQGLNKVFTLDPFLVEKLSGIVTVSSRRAFFYASCRENWLLVGYTNLRQERILHSIVSIFRRARSCQWYIRCTHEAQLCKAH